MSLYHEGGVLSGEKLLLLQAPLTLAPLTAERHLQRAVLPALEMFVCNIRKRINEDGVAIETLGSLDSGVVGILDHFLIKFIESLDVVTRKRNWHQDDVCLAPLDVLLDRVARLCSKPGRRSHLRLPAQAVGVAEV